MKNCIKIILLLSSSTIFAQVGRAGINTSAPKTTLDVNGKTDTSGNLLSTDVTGLQAPRLTRAELTAKGNALYGTDQKGALVYITDISGGDAVSQRVNVDTIGYYFFDGAVWQKMTGSGAGLTDWAKSGTTNAAVTADNQYITGSAGIGVTTPSNKLHVKNTTDPLRLEGVQTSTSTSDKTLVIDTNGVLKTAINSNSYVSGYLSTNLTANSVGINKIIMQTELLDFGNEYNTTTGLFTPTSSGTYIYEMLLTTSHSGAIGTPGSQTNNLIFGMANNSTGQWISRYQQEATVADRSYFVKAILFLTAGVSYYFGIAAQIVPGVLINSNPSGFTGSGIGTFFSISRLN